MIDQNSLNPRIFLVNKLLSLFSLSVRFVFGFINEVTVAVDGALIVLVTGGLSLA